MLTRNVASSNQVRTHDVSSDTSIPASFSTSKEVELLKSYFELLFQIDQRLIKEDPEYRNKYYPEKTLEKEK